MGLARKRRQFNLERSGRFWRGGVLGIDNGSVFFEPLQKNQFYEAHFIFLVYPETLTRGFLCAKWRIRLRLCAKTFKIIGVATI